MSKQSSLSSILVDLGLSPAQLGEVQAREVIYGGDQELNLLELNLVTERDLLRALALLTSLPPAPEGYLHIDASLTRMLPPVPSPTVVGYSDDGKIAVYVYTAPDSDLTLAVQTALGGPVKWLAATRMRIVEGLTAMALGHLTVRESSQLEKLGPRPTEAPLERVVSEDAPTAVPPEVQQTAHAIAPPPRSSSTPAIEEAPYRPLGAAIQHLEDNPPAPIIETAPPPVGYEEIAASSIYPGQSASISPSPRQKYSAREASADLRGAKNRDRVIDVLVHYADQFFEYSAIFAVLSSEAKGMRSSGRGALTDVVKKLRIPLDLPSVFKDARESSSPKIARLRASGLEGGIARDLDRPTGREIFLLPICVRDRAVLLLWGDKGREHVDLGALAELIDFAPVVSESLERVLMEHMRASRVARPMDAMALARRPAPEPGEAPPVSRFGGERSRTQPLVSGQPIAMPMVVTPATQRNPAAPAAQAPNIGGDPPGTLEVARAAKRTLSQSHTPGERTSTDSEPPMAFPAEAPRTLRGFPEVKSPDQVASRFQSRAEPVVTKKPSGRPPLLSRRIVPLGEVTGASLAPPPPAPAPPAPPPPNYEDPENVAPPPPHIEVRDLNDDDDDDAPRHSARGTMMSRRPKISEPAEDGWGGPAAPGVQVIAPVKKSGGSQGASCALLVQQLLAGDETTIPQLVESGETAVGALIAEFPGPVSEPKDAGTPASACGPILKALAALGTKATPFLTVRTADEDATVRRWAAFLLGELPGKESAKAIAGRLLDESIDVRRAALISARRVRSDVLTRRTLRSQVEDMCRDKTLLIESRCSAVEALADIREHEAIPTLLKMLDDKDKSLVRASRWALSVLTRQDFGTDNEAWRTFWQEHRDQDRVEWLIASLSHSQRDLRRAAGEELLALAGQDFGFHEDHPEPQLRGAQAKFREWWNAEGKASLA